MSRVWFAYAWLLGSWFVVSSGRAQNVDTFALIITNNRSISGSQPDLQYADDDGARYFRLFSSVGNHAQARLLTRFDRASLAAYPGLVSVARAPTTAEVMRARDELAKAIEQARAAGQLTRLYVIYAGHGDVLDGRGVLELEDAQIDGAFVERELLDRLAADEKHVILDSCNSFFVMNPRKPGGRRWATPEDMALGFSTRHPEVGLFLSTNSESEVFEWSELESGVFSHEVRSGLSGAADVDGNGSVSYVELAGFIEHANLGIAREGLRPHLFFRGPSGDRHAPIFSNRELRGRKVELATAQTRMWVKTASGERLLDLHKEEGPMTLVVPEGEGELSAYVQTTEPQQGSRGAARTVVAEYSLQAGDGPVQLASLVAAPPQVVARGQRLFGELFALPYGPVALGKFEQATDDLQAKPVYGVTSDDLTRMGHYLEEFAYYGRTRRTRTATLLFGYSALALVPAVAAAATCEGEICKGDVGVFALMGGLSASFMAGGLTAALRSSHGERALVSFRAEVTRGPVQGARAFAETDALLERMATRERRRRYTALFFLQGTALVMLAGGIVDARALAHSYDPPGGPQLALTMFAGSGLMSALGFIVGLTKSPAERMLKLYRDDPKIQWSMSPSLSTTAAGLQFKGSF
ncbi:MAG: hypothetical protein QM778_27295 [Myxococcales bacterium]